MVKISAHDKKKLFIHENIKFLALSILINNEDEYDGCDICFNYNKQIIKLKQGEQLIHSKILFEYSNINRGTIYLLLANICAKSSQEVLFS